MTGAVWVDCVFLSPVLSVGLDASEGVELGEGLGVGVYEGWSPHAGIWGYPVSRALRNQQ